MKNLLFLRKHLLFCSVLALISTGCSKENIAENPNVIQGVDLVTSSKKMSHNNFTSSLKGRNEVPVVDSKAAGEAIVRISKDENSIYFKLIVSNMDNVVAAHFHMAPEGVNGPVVAFLFSGAASGLQNGILSEGVITAADLIGPLAGMDLNSLIQRIRSGNIYVNVHTVVNPGGEIRGQL